MQLRTGHVVRTDANERTAVRGERRLPGNSANSVRFERYGGTFVGIGLAARIVFRETGITFLSLVRDSMTIEPLSVVALPDRPARDENVGRPDIASLS